MAERVDKRWQTQGIETYSIEAILGSLAHYGVNTSEEDFKAKATQAFPLAIAGGWHQTWKGTGQFSHFPAVAAEELWRRLLPTEIAPTDVALALINLLKDLARLIDDKPDQGTLETRFKVVEAYLPRVPTEPLRRQRFIDELFAALGDWNEPYEAVVASLLVNKHDAQADRFVALDEGLQLERVGLSSARLRAARGDEAGAISAVEAIANDSTKPLVNRLAAVETLIDLKRPVLAAPVALALLDEARKSKDLEQLSAIVESLREILRVEPKLPQRREVLERIDALINELGPEPQAP